MTIRITGDGPKITATGSGSTVLVEISTGQHDPGSFSGVHNDLTGRSTTGAHVGTAVSIDPSGFAGNLDESITNAQLLAAAVDDLTTGGGGGGGGVTDHGLLTGLSDDDHTQYAKKASNLSDLASAATARTNLGLGTAAVAATGDFDAAGTAAGLVDDLSGVSNQATARTNLGLGSAAVEAVSAFATAAQGVDARTPTAHKASHENGGSDPVTLAQSQVTNLTSDLAAKVPSTRTVNGYDLTTNRSLTATDVGGYPAPLWPRTTGEYINGALTARGTGAHPATAAGVLLVQPVWLRSGSIDRMWLRISATNTATWRLGIYPINSSTLSPAGQTLLVDAGTINMNTTTGIIALTVSTSIPSDGLWGLAVLVDAHTSVPNVHCVSGDATSNAGVPKPWTVGMAAPSTGMPMICWRAGSVATGSMPSTCPSVTEETITPLIGVRYA